MGSEMADEILQGAAACIAKLRDLGKLDNGSAIKQAVRAGMLTTMDEARTRIAVGTRSHKVYTGQTVSPGFARKSIKIITVLSADKQQATAILGVSKEAFYAVQFLELGTSKMPAQPWLRPAFYGTQSDQQQAIVAKLQEYINKVVAAGS
jgi:HK97 gp10 family phage protein